MDVKAVAFAGSRPARLPWRSDEFSPACMALKEIMTEKIAGFAEQGIVNFMSGMALGIDTIAAEAVLALRERDSRVKLHCILPCTSQADEWPPLAQERYRNILTQADTICFVNREYHKDVCWSETVSWLHTPQFCSRSTKESGAVGRRPLSAMPGRQAGNCSSSHLIR